MNQTQQPREITHAYPLLRVSELALDAAIEIDRHILGRTTTFQHTQELSRTLGDYQLRDDDTALTTPHFDYLALRRTFIKGSEKRIDQFSDLALEMRLLRAELDSAPHVRNPEDLRSYLCDLSRMMQATHYAQNPMRHYAA
ncbi:MAG: hypothetical protein ABIH41_07010 [Nanoarchaeota archaeon]